MSFDDAVLDDAELLSRRDPGGLLWALATAGAQVKWAATGVPVPPTFASRGGSRQPARAFSQKICAATFPPLVAMLNRL